MADLIEQQWTVGDYLSFVTSLIFWIGVSFELPLFVYFLAKLGVIDAATLRRNRKYALVIIAVLAAVITHRVARATALRDLAPDWESWHRGWDFPMGLSLGATLAAYLGLVIFFGG